MGDSFFMDGGVFSLFVVLVIGLMVFGLVMGIRQWSHNNKQPQIPAPARVVSKRVATHHQDDGNGNVSVSHSYYVTFAYTNGEQVEVRLSHRRYREIDEGDSGTLTMQGTRFIDFKAL